MDPVTPTIAPAGAAGGRRTLEESETLLAGFRRIQRLIVERAPLGQVLRDVCGVATAVVGGELAAIRLVDPSGGDELVLVASVGLPDDVRGEVTRSGVSEGVAGRAVSERRVVATGDYPEADFARPALSRIGIRSAVAAPLVEATRVVGSLTVGVSRAGHVFDATARDALGVLAEQASVAVANARAVDALHSTLREALHSVTHDPLTGLPNRSLLFEHLDELLRLRRADEAVAVLFIDLDRFKAVNDSLGHDAGDRVLVEVARRLRAAVRPSDLVARLAGDEFVVVCPGLHGEVDALGLADRITHEVVRPVATPVRDVIVTASIGVAQSAGMVTADELLRDADMAMYRAKERGSDRVEVFGSSLRATVRARLDLEHALRRAIGHRELRVDYQPVVDLTEGRARGVEALVRWDHDGRLVPPGEFIPVAEATGLVVDVGSWVLREACTQVAGWRTLEGLGDLKVAVNVSLRQFADGGFVGTVEEALDVSGLPPGALSLEVTETLLLDDVDAGIRTLRELKAIGVDLAIDDFGTGYSSLAQLRRFPVDVLKIDRSFVEQLGVEPEQTAILAAVVQLGAALGVGVVAEGVETAQQVDELRRLGVSCCQGFYFSPARPAADALSWLQAGAEGPVTGARAG